ncbi:MAG: ferritin [Salibacteraceae bacterium]|jgi:ferritin
MFSNKVEEALNKQVKLEGYSSHFYLSMAVWAEGQGFEGVANFMYKHSDEERQHMLKMVKFMTERGAEAQIPSINQPPAQFSSLKELFTELLTHEMGVTNAINGLVHLTLGEQDYTTHNFLQWYVAEQIEEEALARTILDKLKIIGEESGSGIYMFDRDINSLVVTSASVDTAG